MNTKAILLSAILVCFNLAGEACTSAIISAGASASGRPILWKHRDTGEENNKVERIAATDSSMGYVAIFNASDSLCHEAWMGMNEAGFAIMNTASYNLKNDTITAMDAEGLIMAEALAHCRTVEDFAQLLQTHEKPLRVEANFGVMDAAGNGAYFETDNYNYTRYNVSDSPFGILIRTNYSHSGRKDEGYGYIREANAAHFLYPAAEKKAITPEFLTETVSRNFYHNVLGADYTESGVEWVVDQDFIPRYTSTATCAIEGIAPGEDVSLTDMWVGIGYPPASEIRLVTMSDEVPAELRGVLANGHSPLCDTAVDAKHKAFSITRGNGNKYVNLGLLYNKRGTGIAQIAKRKNETYYKNARRQRQERIKK